MQNFFNRIIKFSIYALVFLVPLFFLPFSFELFEYNKQYLLFFLVSLSFFAWLAKMVIYDKEIRFKRSPLDVFVLAFLGIAILSAIFSADKSSSLFGFYGRFSNGLIGLLSFGALYFLITNNVGVKSVPTGHLPKGDKYPNPNITVSGLLKAFSWSAFFVVFLSFFAFFGIWAKLANLLFLPKAMASRIFNPISASSEGLAVFLAVVAVFLVGRMLTAKKSTRLSSIANCLFLAAILFLLTLIDFTAAWLILLITFVLLLAFSLWKRVFRENANRLLVPIFLVMIAAVCLPLPSRTLIFGEGSTIASLPREQVLSQRTSWQIGLGGATDTVKNGFLGSGIGTFSYDFAKEKPLSINRSWLWQIRFDRPGSYVAEVLGTLGFLGIFSYLALMAIFLRISYCFLQQKLRALLFLMVLVALLISQFVYYQNTTLSFLFWFVLGMSVISWQKPIKEKKISFKDFPELSLVFSTLVIILGVAFLVAYFYGIKFYLADVSYAASQTMDLGAKSTEMLEKAVRQNPGLPQYRAVLARTYMNEVLSEMQKSSSEQDADKIQVLVATAINQARIASDLAPNQVAMWETLGMVYREIRSVATGAVDWGIKSFERAIILEPTNPIANTELGKLYLAANKTNEAREQFAKALEKKPDYTDALIQQTLLLEKEGDVSGAISQMEKLAGDWPYNAEILFQLGRLYYNNNQVNEAIAQFKRVVILAPNHSNAHYSLGVAYTAQKKTTLAIEEFEKVLELNPGNADVQEKIDQLR